MQRPGQPPADIHRETHRLAANLYRHFRKLLDSEMVNPYWNNGVNQIHDFDLEGALRQLGLKPISGELASTTMDLPQYYQLLALAAPHLQEYGFYLALGDCFDITDAGLLGYASLSVENFRQSWELTTKNYALYPHPVLAQRRIENRRVSVSLSSPGHNPSTCVYLHEEWLASTWKWMHQRLPRIKDEPGLQLKLGYPAPTYQERYQHFFPGDISFDHGQTELSFPEAWYDLPFPSANPATAVLCQEQCSLIMSQLDNYSHLVDQVRRLLLLSPQRQFPSLEWMANEFRLPPHTFHRRLKKADTSYKHIVNEVRMELAKEYLANTALPLQEISYLLGYDYTPNFFRAFKKWFHVTAADYRKSAQPLNDL